MQTTRIMTETVVYFGEASRRLPGEPHRRTVEDWALKGMKGAGGMRHTIEWCQLTNGRATSIEAYHRFIERLNGEQPPLAEDVKAEEERKRNA